MANLAYSTNIQDQVATLLFQTSYSGLSSSHKLGIDNTWTTGALTGGAAKSAWDSINQYSQWWYQAGATVSPDIWQHWLVHRICRIYAVQARPDRVADFRALEAQSQTDALASFTKEDPNDSSVGTDATAATYKSIRFTTMETLLSRNPPIFASPAEIDSATVKVMRDMWNRGDWVFKRRPVTMQIAANGTVTFTLSNGDVFHSFSTTQLYYADLPYKSSPLVFADQDEMTRRTIEWTSTTGRPRYFRFYRTGSTITWQFAPTPDAAYNAFGEIFIEGPHDPSSSTDTVPFTQFPTEFIPLIKDGVLARVLYNRGVADGREQVARFNDEVDRMAPKYIEVGNVDRNPRPRDVYQDFITYGDGMYGGNT